MRRSFLQAVSAGAVAAGATPEPRVARTRYYTLESILLENGDQAARLHDFLTRGFLPAARRVHGGPIILLEALVAQHMPQFAMIAGFPSAAEAMSWYTRLHEQEGYTAAVEKWESGPNSPYEETTSMLLEAADYSPEIPAANEPPKQPRVFELRTYHSPTWRQLGALHQRFAEREIPIFHRNGIHPLLYTTTVFGNHLPNLTYLIPFENLAARERAWNAFGADGDWIRVRKESVEQNGEITPVIRISLFKATSYSPVQ